MGRVRVGRSSMWSWMDLELLGPRWCLTGLGPAGPEGWKEGRREGGGKWRRASRGEEGCAWGEKTGARVRLGDRLEARTRGRCWIVGLYWYLFLLLNF